MCYRSKRLNFGHIDDRTETSLVNLVKIFGKKQKFYYGWKSETNYSWPSSFYSSVSSTRFPFAFKRPCSSSPPHPEAGASPKHSAAPVQNNAGCFIRQSRYKRFHVRFKTNRIWLTSHRRGKRKFYSIPRVQNTYRFANNIPQLAFMPKISIMVKALKNEADLVPITGWYRADERSLNSA